MNFEHPHILKGVNGNGKLTLTFFNMTVSTTSVHQQTSRAFSLSPGGNFLYAKCYIDIQLSLDFVPVVSLHKHTHTHNDIHR